LRKPKRKGARTARSLEMPAFPAGHDTIAQVGTPDRQCVDVGSKARRGFLDEFVWEVRRVEWHFEFPLK